MLMRDYPKVDTYNPTDIVLIDQLNGGTKQLSLGDLAKGDNDPTQNMIAETEQQLSTKRHLTGEYLIYENTMCKVISDIPIGGTLSFGVNIEPTTVGDEISSIGSGGGSDQAARRMIFRGKNLGSVVTQTQRDAIRNGTFNDLYVGDYWVINGVNWRIADFDYYLGCGDTDFTQHHVVIVPDKPLYNAQMNTSNVTTGGYVGSRMYTHNLANAKNAITSAFGTLVLTHREYLTNAVTSGYPSGGLWADSSVDLMNEPMVYGSYIFAPGSTGAVVPYRYTTAKQQLALFMLKPEFVNIRENYWLRDVVSAAAFAYVGHNGAASHHTASNSLGVRPAFAIG